MTDSNQEETTLEEITTKLIPFRVTEREAAALKELSKRLGIKASNIIRQGVSKVAQEAGVDLPEGVFDDRPGGNWKAKPKGKENPLAA